MVSRQEWRPAAPCAYVGGARGATHVAGARTLCQSRSRPAPMATLSRAPGEAANQAGCARAVRGRAASARLWHGHAGLGPCPHRPGCPTPCQPGRCARTGVLVGASGRRAFRAPVWPHLAVRVDRAKVALGGPAALATTLGCSLVFLAAHPVGALAAAVSLDSFIRVFDVDTGASVATLEAPPSEVWCVQFHPKVSVWLVPPSWDSVSF